LKDDSGLYLQSQAVQEEQPHGGQKVCYIGIFVVAGGVSNPGGGGSGRGFILVWS